MSHLIFKAFPFLAALLCLSGCRPDASHRHSGATGHSHDHGAATVSQITAWSERYEIFIEHQPPVADEPVVLTAHVTKRPEWKPKRAGEIVLAFEKSGERFEARAAEPDRPGVYLIRATFSFPGEWRASVRIAGEKSSEVLSLPDIRVYPTAHAAAHAPAEQSRDAGAVDFLKEQQWKMGIGVHRVERRPRLTERMAAPGTFEAQPGAAADVRSPISGTLHWPEGAAGLRVGDRVEENDILALIRPSLSDLGVRLAEAEANFRRARIDLEQTRSHLERTRRLAETKAKSPRQVEEAEFAYRKAQARANALKRLLVRFQAVDEDEDVEYEGKEKEGDAGLLNAEAAFPGWKIRSPIGGVIVEQAPLGAGEWVSEGARLFRVLDSARLLLRAYIPEADVGRVGEPSNAVYELASQPGRFHPLGQGGATRLLAIGAELDRITRSIPLLYAVDNSEGGLRPGQSATVWVQTGEAFEALAIPASAVIEEKNRPIAYVQTAGESFERRFLELGARDGAWLEVRSGIEEGEHVVDRGAYVLRLASSAAEVPAHGHAH